MEKMFEYCESDIKGINFIKVSKEDIAPVRQMLSTRFESGKTIPGTRSFHHFSPLSEGEVTYKRVSDDEVVAGTFKFFDVVLADHISHITIMEFIACQYDSLWWVGLLGLTGSALISKVLLFSGVMQRCDSVISCGG